MKTRLPTGIDEFRTLREKGLHYVDKTPWARQMVDEGRYFFLSRPRRFGKSLFVDMLGELFAGSKDLFHGLHIHRHWDWSKHHPVVRLDFAGGDFTRPDFLDKTTRAQLNEAAQDASIRLRHESTFDRFRELLKVLHQQTRQRVVVLVDEYDKPIMDALETPELANANRNFLRGLYGTLKPSRAHVQFVFLTGVSRFSKGSFFSGLNNIKDVTLNPRYAGVCGYTEADLDETFGEEVAGLDRRLIREWYNGYNWLGEERLYNPYDVLLLLEEREFEPWWYATGTPAFLPAFLARRLVRPDTAFPSLEGTVIEAARLEAFDVEHIDPPALLFQTGYLTIAERDTRAGLVRYRLEYPNREVRQSFSENLLAQLAARGDGEPGDASRAGPEAGELLRSNDFDGLERQLRTFLAGSPYQWHTNNPMAFYEGHWASVVLAYLRGDGLRPMPERSVSGGRIDLVLRHAGQVFLFEFKVIERAHRGAALEQIKQQDCAAGYLNRGEPVHLIGAEFSGEERNLVALDVETIPA